MLAFNVDADGDNFLGLDPLVLFSVLSTNWYNDICTSHCRLFEGNHGNFFYINVLDLAIQIVADLR